jgi:hypothetical protein
LKIKKSVKKCVSEADTYVTQQDGKKQDGDKEDIKQ